MAQKLNVDTSIVDYLKSIGRDSSIPARAKLAEQYGIQGYSPTLGGTAEQNIALLKAVKGGAPTAKTQPTTTTVPTPTTVPQPTTPTAPPTITTPPTTSPDTTTYEDIINSDPYLKSSYKAMQEGNQYLKDMESELGILTSEEEAEIERQAIAAGVPYDALIAQAKEAKRQGVAKATVRAGQRGGFESTQMAGAAAAPRELINQKLKELSNLGVIVDSTAAGDGTFIGQGGELEKIQSAYNTQIQNVEAQKIAAINAARSALREAKLTGQTAKYNRAVKLFELAQKSQEDALNMAYKRVEALKAVENLRQSQITFEQKQTDKAIGEAVTMLVNMDENGNIVMPSDEEIQQYISDNNYDPTTVGAAIQNRIAELNKLSAEEQKAALNAEYLKTNIERTKFLTERDIAKGVGGGGGGGRRGGGEEEFTSTELKRIEQAGLDEASREEKLDYLFGTQTEKDAVLKKYNPTNKEEGFAPRPDAVDLSDSIVNDLKAGDSKEDIASRLAERYGFSEDLANRLVEINSAY
jgi:hypothetical protein